MIFLNYNYEGLFYSHAVLHYTNKQIVVPIRLQALLVLFGVSVIDTSPIWLLFWLLIFAQIQLKYKRELTMCLSIYENLWIGKCVKNNKTI